MLLKKMRVKEASVIPVVVEEKLVEVEEVETIKPVENQPYFYEDRVASNVAIEDYTLPAEEQISAVAKEEAKEKGTVAKKNILFLCGCYIISITNNCHCDNFNFRYCSPYNRH
nr:hypothetical protein [Mycoplasmopsis bovis]